MRADVTVVGAGVVGLAVAARLAPRVRQLVLLERNERFGQEASSRNSEVIHSGIYYAPGSLKARLCVEGNRLLYELCEAEAIPHRRVEKLVLAQSEDEVPLLAQLHGRGTENGVPGMELLSSERVRRLEPAVRCEAGLHCATTGIVDSWELMRVLHRRALEAGASFAPCHTVTGIDATSGGLQVETQGPGGTQQHKSRIVVNAAGLEADTVASVAGLDIDALGYRQHPCKGDYFLVSPAKSDRVRRLIYPVRRPGDVGLGIHTVVDLQGRLRLGPDATYVRRGSGLTVDASKREQFLEAVRAFLPFLEIPDLEPEMAGIRAKLAASGEGEADFVVSHEARLGLSGLVNLVGIDSPGLTASLALAREVEGQLDEAVLLSPD